MIRLTEVQERRLRPLIDELPGRRTLIAQYPRPRLRGTVTLPSGQVLTAPPLPGSQSGIRTRVVPFNMAQTANSRRTLSTPPLRGPAILRGLHYVISVRTSPSATTLEIGWARLAVIENSVALTTPRPYTSLTELQDPFGTITDPSGNGLIIGTQPATHVDSILELNLLVEADELVFTLSIVNNGGNGQECYGFLTIIEGLNPAQPYPF